MRGKLRVLATLVIGELMFAFGEGWSSSEAITDQGSGRVFQPSRREKSARSDPKRRGTSV